MVSVAPNSVRSVAVDVTDSDPTRSATGSDSTWDAGAVLAGAGADAAVAALAATVALSELARWPAFGAVLAGGLLAGFLAGRRAGGRWGHRARHGLLAGVLGGAALAAAVWWSLFPGTPLGAFRPANYVLAVAAGRLPPGVAAAYDSVIAAAAALAFGLLYAAEGWLAAGAASGGNGDLDDGFESS